MNVYQRTILVLFLFFTGAANTTADTFDISDCDDTDLRLNKEICEALNEANANSDDILAMWAQGNDKIDDKMAIAEYWNNYVQPESTAPDGADIQPITFKGETIGEAWVVTAAANPSYKFNNITYVPEEFEVLTWHYYHADLPESTEQRTHPDLDKYGNCKTEFKDWKDQTIPYINDKRIQGQNQIATYQSTEPRAESYLEVVYTVTMEEYSYREFCPEEGKLCLYYCDNKKVSQATASAAPSHEIKDIQSYQQTEPNTPLIQFTATNFTNSLLIANSEAEQYTLQTDSAKIFSTATTYQLRSRASPYNALYIEKVPTQRLYYVKGAQVKKRSNTSIHLATYTDQATLTVHHPFSDKQVQVQVQQEEFPAIEILTDQYRYDPREIVKVDIETNQPDLPIQVRHCSQKANTHNVQFQAEPCGTIEVDIAGITKSKRIAITKSLTPLLPLAAGLTILFFLGKAFHHIIRRQAL